MPRESSEKPFKDARNSITILGFFVLFCLQYCFQKIEAFRLSLLHSSQRLQMVLELIVRSPYDLQFLFWKASNLLLRFGECQLDGLVIVCRERHGLRFRFNRAFLRW